MAHPDGPDLDELETREWRERYDIETERLEDAADTDYGEDIAPWTGYG